MEKLEQLKKDKFYGLKKFNEKEPFQKGFFSYEEKQDILQTVKRIIDNFEIELKDRIKEEKVNIDKITDTILKNQIFLLEKNAFVPDVSYVLKKYPFDEKEYKRDFKKKVLLLYLFKNLSAIIILCNIFNKEYFNISSTEIAQNIKILYGVEYDFFTRIPKSNLSKDYDLEEKKKKFEDNDMIMIDKLKKFYPLTFNKLKEYCDILNFTKASEIFETKSLVYFTIFFSQQQEEFKFYVGKTNYTIQKRWEEFGKFDTHSKLAFKYLGLDTYQSFLCDLYLALSKGINVYLFVISKDSFDENKLIKEFFETTQKDLVKNIDEGRYKSLLPFRKIFKERKTDSNPVYLNILI